MCEPEGMSLERKRRLRQSVYEVMAILTNVATDWREVRWIHNEVEQECRTHWDQPIPC